jgi:hypothetical protein
MPPPKQQFQFVNIDNPEQSGDAETRKLVRRHVMHQHLQKRLEEQKRQAQASEASNVHSPTTSWMCDCFGSLEETVLDSKNRGKLLAIETCSICGRSFLKDADASPQAVTTRPQSPAKEIEHFRSGRTDPFNTYAIDNMRPYMHGLLDHRASN